MKEKRLSKVFSQITPTSTVGLVSYVGRFGSHVVDSHELALLLSLLRKSSKIMDFPLINAVASGYYWNLFWTHF